MAPSQGLPAARHSVPSPDGALVATVQRARLLVRSAPTGALVRSWTLPQDFVIKCQFVRWSRHAVGGAASNRPVSNRLLLADSHSIRVFDVDDAHWKASVENIAGSLGQVSDVDWGFSPNEVLVTSDFGIKLTIWSLLTSRGAEIRDPKPGRRCYDLRPTSGHLAVLTRPSNQDILMLIDPKTHEVVRSVDLVTVDAQEVQWSPDGNWIAIRDVASTGYKIQIYTADGNLFRTFTGLMEAGEIDLGAKSIVWNPAGPLAIGDFNGGVAILNQKTFSPVLSLQHSIPLDLPGRDVWEEQIQASGERSYVRLDAPATPPASSAFSKTTPAKRGVSIVAFNRDGSMLATKDDVCPTTVWIWSAKTGKIIAAIIHHSPVKSLAWHHAQVDLLLVHCAVQEPIVHLWKSNWVMPLVLALPLTSLKGRLEAHWLQSSHEDHFKLLLSSQIQAVDAYISPAGDLVTDEESSMDFKASEDGPEDLFDEGNSLDLSPVKFGNTEDLGFLGHDAAGFGLSEQGIEDTFHYRKQVKATG